MKRMFLVLLGVLIGLELVLRLPPVWAVVVSALTMGPSPVERMLRDQSRAAPREFIRDSELGNRPVPSRRQMVRTHDFEYLLELDSAGFPNREPWPRPSDIVVLGNSLVVGQGVGIDRQFSTLLGQKLGTTQVVNLGLGGASPEHEYRIYRRYAKSLHPRLVLAVLWVASDVTNAADLAHWLASGRKQDYFEYRTTGAARPKPGPAGRGAAFIRRRSWVLRALFGARAAIAGSRQPHIEQVSTPSGDTLYLSAKTEKALAEGMSRPGLPSLKRLFFEPLIHLRDEVEADGGQVVVVLIPSKEELYAADAYPPVLHAVREVRAGLDSLGFTTVDLYASMRLASVHGALFFPRDIHFTAQGNQVVADALADWLLKRRVPTHWEPEELGGVRRSRP